MYDTWITLIGNVVNDPLRRRTERTGAAVTSFRLASTSRRFDKESGRWTDGNTLFVKVACWRQLADHVKDSVERGMPVIVVGRIYTREYEVEVEIGAGDTAQKVVQKRSSYELDAVSVGHDLARGKASFERYKPPAATHEVNDGTEINAIGGERTVEHEGDVDGASRQEGFGGFAADGAAGSDPWGELPNDSKSSADRVPVGV